MRVQNAGVQGPPLITGGSGERRTDFLDPREIKTTAANATATTNTSNGPLAAIKAFTFARSPDTSAMAGTAGNTRRLRYRLPAVPQKPSSTTQGENRRASRLSLSLWLLELSSSVCAQGTPAWSPSLRWNWPMRPAARAALRGAR